MAGLIELRKPDFPVESMRLLVFDFDGVFTDNAVWVSQDGQEQVRCWRSDGLGLAKLRDIGFPVWVLSTEVNPVVSKRCEKLKIPCRQDLPNKEQALRQLCQELGISINDVIYVGNDINDLGCLKTAGISIVVQDAHPDVRHAAHYQTNIPGGFGAVREVCDWLFLVRGLKGISPQPAETVKSL